MAIIILHSELSEDSRNFITSLGVTITSDDMSENINSVDVRIISDHIKAVDICPNFQGYPVVIVRKLVDDVEKEQQLFAPETWEKALTWINDDPFKEPIPTGE